MRKVRFLWLIAIVMTVIVSLVHAQDDPILGVDEWVSGDIDANDYEDRYVFEGSAGDVVLIEAYVPYLESQLDAELDLLDPSGEILATNDDYVFTYGYVGSIIVVELPEDGSYTVVVTRFEREEGTSSGAYQLRLRRPDLVQPGMVLEATIFGQNAEDLPVLYVLRPDRDGIWTLNFSREAGDLFPAIQMRSWTGDLFEDETVFSLENTQGVREGSLKVDLRQGVFYVLNVGKGSFVESEQGQAQVRIDIVP